MFVHHYTKPLSATAMVYIVSGLIFFLSAIEKPAFSADPSPEQCTCDLRGFNEKTGAEVVNAASCVLTLKYPWCDIFLASTEDSDAHKTIVSELRRTDGFLDLQDVLMPMFERFVEAVGRENPDLASEYAANESTIVRLMEEYFEELLYCLDAFEYREPVTGGTGSLSCAVGSLSGWLKLEFRVHDRSYLFLFAPEE